MQHQPPAPPIAVTNDQAHTIYRHGVAIPPGETRHFPAHEAPGPAVHARAEPVPETGFDVATFLDGSVSEIVPALAGLTDAELAAVERAEIDGKTRKTLMAAITEQKVRRAEEDSAAAAADARAAELAALDDVELIELAAETDDEALRGMIQAEQQRRDAERAGG